MRLRLCVPTRSGGRYPDTVRFPDFPGSPVLRPGEEYQHATTYAFEWVE